MSVESISNTLNAANANSASADKTSLIGNYEMFLELLTTQLRNQSPLEPLDANQFTEQLVQYSSIEQQVKTNDNLSSMLATLASANATSLVGYVGREIEAHGSVAPLKNSSATWRFDAASAGPTTEIEIRNAAGTLVKKETTSIASGEQSYAWDGRMDNGQIAPDGPYSITIAAKDTNGNAVSVDTKVTGTVTEVDMSGPEAVLRIGDISVPLSALLAVRQGSS